jgi:uncharacterized membrane protein (UPF0127 family)
MSNATIINLSNPLSRRLSIHFCTSFFDRLRGLTFRHSLDEEEGILLVQERNSRIDAAIHMFFVSFNIAVIWIDSGYNVTDKCIAKSWYPFYIPKFPSRYVMEIHPSRFNEFSIGDHVQFDEV